MAERRSFRSSRECEEDQIFSRWRRVVFSFARVGENHGLEGFGLKSLDLRGACLFRRSDSVLL